MYHVNNAPRKKFKTKKEILFLRTICKWTLEFIKSHEVIKGFLEKHPGEKFKEKTLKSTTDLILHFSRELQVNFKHNLPKTIFENDAYWWIYFCNPIKKPALHHQCRYSPRTTDPNMFVRAAETRFAWETMSQYDQYRVKWEGNFLQLVSWKKLGRLSGRRCKCYSPHLLDIWTKFKIIK